MCQQSASKVRAKCEQSASTAASVAGFPDPCRSTASGGRPLAGGIEAATTLRDCDQATGAACDALSALYDPACRARRKTHREVAYAENGFGYGVYRQGGSKKDKYNAWLCRGADVIPARLIIESLDADHMTRMLVPVALASGGYVDLLNGGWDHSSALECGGYSCMKRMQTFHATVAVNRSYDLAFTATNPETLRLMMPHGGGELEEGDHAQSRLLVSIFYSNPEKLEVYFNGRKVPPLEAHLPSNNQFNFSMVKPTIDDGCGANAFAAWENKIHVLLCGGIPGIEIKTVDAVVLSLGIEVTTENFFDSHYLVRNLASLFGIPSERMRVPKIVAGSKNIDIEMGKETPGKGGKGRSAKQARYAPQPKAQQQQAAKLAMASPQPSTS